MQRELTIPQVFEPGARVAWDNAPGAPRVLTKVRDGWWFGWCVVQETETQVFEAHDPPGNLRVVAPAPRPGQRWLGNGLLVTLHEGVVPASKGVWLAERGLEYDGETSTLPFTSLEPLPPPAQAEPVAAATPTRPLGAVLRPQHQGVADARGAILDAIRSEAPRHRDAFTSALCSMAELFVPSERMILVAASALSAAEEQLPERGAIAPWQEELAARAAREVMERAYGKGGAPMLCVEACARYLERRAGR